MVIVCFMDSESSSVPSVSTEHALHVLVVTFCINPVGFKKLYVPFQNSEFSWESIWEILFSFSSQMGKGQSPS